MYRSVIAHNFDVVLGLHLMQIKCKVAHYMFLEVCKWILFTEHSTINGHFMFTFTHSLYELALWAKVHL